jgi:cation diffusion facilitator CzcD-associated flavoprotein CzcO
MTTLQQQNQGNRSAARQKTDYDAIVIGAGFAGLCLIHYLREAGLSVRVFDKASDIGGTWTWNRYPGAMTDSGMVLAETLSRLGGNPALHALCRRQVRHVAAHSIEHGDYQRRIPVR